MNAFREIGIMADRINLPRKIVVSDFVQNKSIKSIGGVFQIRLLTVYQ